jgi:uncharacterized pyridoxal phosphate-containing UPF0001 family protein
VDRLKIAERLSAQRPEGLAPLQVCIDSVHEHQRQMYVLDVSGIVGG